MPSRVQKWATDSAASPRISSRSAKPGRSPPFSARPGARRALRPARPSRPRARSQAPSRAPMDGHGCRWPAPRCRPRGRRLATSRGSRRRPSGGGRSRRLSPRRAACSAPTAASAQPSTAVDDPCPCPPGAASLFESTAVSPNLARDKSSYRPRCQEARGSRFCSSSSRIGTGTPRASCG